jgi:release factor glutamine methyltransferase
MQQNEERPDAGGQPLVELLDAGSAYLERKGIPSPRVVCELLAGRLLGAPRLGLHDFLPLPVGAARVAALRRGLARVAAGEPVQYVLGEWDFRGLTLTVDRRALIPRPETEQLIDHVLATPALWRNEQPRVVDVGTGSGCIALSLAQERPQARLVAIDSSPDALALARENADRCGLAARVDFREGSGCGAFRAGSIDAVVSNPPYIPSSVVPTLDRWICDHEPLAALDGGADGLTCIRAITRDAAMVLKPDGCLFYEIGEEQGPAVRDILESHGFGDVAICNDWSGLVRFATARLRGV